ncbi:MAG TPA: hypothetical protein VK041_08505 [Opitutales bacterium]|nr:hypothetical protein [Opitutales bacterium]
MEERDDNVRNRPIGARAEYVSNRRRISWGAIIAGTIAALAVQLLLTLLGLSIGMWAIDPSAGQEGFQGLGMGAAIWGLASFIIALFVGGWIAGRMAGLESKFDGLLEGFMVWGLVTVVTFMLLTTAISGIVGGAAGLAGDALTSASEQIDDPQQMIQEFGQSFRDEIEEMQDPEAQQQMEQQAKQSGEEVASAGAATSFWAFLALLLGAIAAALAGHLGSSSGLKEAAVTDSPRARPRR